jgi:hypothetical protein
VGDGFFIAFLFVVIAAVGGFFLGQESATPPAPSAQVQRLMLHEAKTELQFHIQFERQQKKIESEIQQLGAAQAAGS